MCFEALISAANHNIEIDLVTGRYDCSMNLIIYANDGASPAGPYGSLFDGCGISFRLLLRIRCFETGSI